MKEIIIISVGGSLIFPDEIDAGFLKNFKNLILKHVKKGKRFALMCGGGKICRRYQSAAKKLTKLSGEDIDWLGINVTIMNAQFIRTIFNRLAFPKVVTNPTEKINFREKILVASGWRPGCSTDYDAALLAKNLKVKKLVNLTNVDYIYDKDPNKFKDAKKIKEISWKEFRGLLPKKWNPGLNVPFDPIAAKKAEKLKLEVAILNGKNIKNLDKYLDNKKFIGTRIS